MSKLKEVMASFEPLGYRASYSCFYDENTDLLNYTVTCAVVNKSDGNLTGKKLYSKTLREAYAISETELIELFNTVKSAIEKGRIPL